MVSPVHRISKNQCREKSTASAGRLELQVLDKATYEIASHMRSSAIHASVVHLAPLLGRLGRRIIFGVALARGALGGLVRLDRRPVP
jgi:hypothetical protein